MAAAGAVVARALTAVTVAARPGVSTAELDEIAETVIREAGAVPTFLGYHGFPASICASVNEVVVHGIPSRETVLATGDIISVDCGAILDGWNGDSAVTLPVGEIAREHQALIDASREVFEGGIRAMVPGAHLTDVSHALELATAEAERRHGVSLGIVDGYGGHGIGREMHEDPFLSNEGRGGRGPVLAEGTTLAVEPMLILGGETDTRELHDGWTVVSVDGSWAAHWEHTVAVTADGPRILTPR